MRTISAFSRVLLAGLLLALPASAQDVAGKWVTTVEGERLVLTLRPGGKGDLEGDPVGWTQRGQQVTLIIDGAKDAGSLAGDRLTIGGFTFKRVGAAARGNAPAVQPAKAQQQAGTAASARGGTSPQAPAPDQALASQLLGCWKRSSGSTDSNSYDRSSERWVFTADGRYQMESTSVISGEFGMARSGSSQQGRWRTVPGQLQLQPDDAEGYAVNVTLRGGMVVVEGRKYLPCR